jgi:uncharacterized protein (TIGR02001 family)
MRNKAAMKKVGWLNLLLIVFLFPQMLPAEEEKEGSGKIKYEISGTLSSHYMWRGLRLSEDGVFQPSATIGSKGFSANLWANYQFDPHRWTEVDFTGAYSGEKGKINYDLGFVHYGVNKGEDSDEIYGGIAHSNILTPSFRVYVDVNAGKGAYLQAGLEPSIKLKKEVSLNLKASAGYVLKNSYMGLTDGGREFSNFYDADFQASLTVPLGKKLSLEPMLGFSTALSRNAQEAIRNFSSSPNKRTLYGGATLTFSLGGSQSQN